VSDHRPTFHLRITARCCVASKCFASQDLLCCFPSTTPAVELLHSCRRVPSVGCLSHPLGIGKCSSTGCRRVVRVHARALIVPCSYIGKELMLQAMLSYCPSWALLAQPFLLFLALWRIYCQLGRSRAWLNHPAEAATWLVARASPDLSSALVCLLSICFAALLIL
jgi:hypothetical protein